jgi:hypothetical protein
MQRISILLFASVFCFATAVQAQAPAPKPGPEVKKLLPLVGHWAHEEEDKPGPLGPGGKSAGWAFTQRTHAKERHVCATCEWRAR